MYRASLDIQKSNVKCFLPKSFALNQFHFDRKKSNVFTMATKPNHFETGSNNHLLR